MKILYYLLIIMSSAILSAQTVYITPSGKKFHTATCSTVKNVSTAVSVQQAMKKGLTACRVCNPGSGTASSGSGNRSYGIHSNEAQGQMNRAVQCSGYTQKGTRCKRMTKNKNGYCFQHER